MLEELPQHVAARIQGGDRDAERELVEQFSRPLRLILLRRTNNPSLAGDLCQDTFVIAIRKLRAGELRNPGALGGFLRQIAVNLSIEHFRKEKRYVSDQDGIISLQAPQVDDKEQRLDRRHIRRALGRALEQLSTPRDREILVRFYLQEEEKQEICAALELTAAHFDRVLYRARQRMKQLLEDQQELRALLRGDES